MLTNNSLERDEFVFIRLHNQPYLLFNYSQPDHHLRQKKLPPHCTILKNNIKSTNANTPIIPYSLRFFNHAFRCNSFNSRWANATLVRICHVSSLAFWSCCRWAWRVARTVFAVVSACGFWQRTMYESTNHVILQTQYQSSQRSKLTCT